MAETKAKKPTVPVAAPTLTPAPSHLAAAVGETKESALTTALECEHGNITRAAVALGIGRATAMRLVKVFGLTELAAKLREAAGNHRGEDGRVLGPPVGSRRKK